MLSVNNIAQFTLLLKNQIRLWRAVHKTTTHIHLGTENIQQISQAPRETPFDIYGWNIVSTMSNTLGNPQFRHLHAGQRQIGQFHPPTVTAQSANQIQITPPCQSRLECKIVLTSNSGFELFKKFRFN